MSTRKTGRNEPCPCGSGRKFKHCCEQARGVAGAATAPAAGLIEAGAQALAAGAVDQAVEFLRRAVALDPRSRQAHANLALALEAKGLHHDALASSHTALQLGRDSVDAAGLRLNYLAQLKGCQARLFELMRSAELTPDQVFAEHRRFGRLCEDLRRASWRPHPNGAEPERRLRIGYVSPDFRRHSVAYFFEPLLAHHDRSQVEVFCYYSCPLSDAITRRIAAQADHWRPCIEMPDEDLADAIRTDRIDILVDLAGHSTGSRLACFALRPAPVQMLYLGYPGTSGMECIDYRLTDRLADPPGLADAWFTERALRLEQAMLVYRPGFGAEGLLGECEPAVPAPPLQRHGHVTFGSFSDMSKLGAGVIEAWSGLLLAVPGSRLTLKARGLERTEAQQELSARFGRHGVAPARLQLLGRDEEPLAHLHRYDDVDIALDPFPYNGVTTSFEALWMGVPVISLEGTTPAARMGVTIASHLGHAEWIAQTPAEYVAKAAALAADPQRLAALRRTLREELRASPLMDGAGFARRLEAAYRRAWADWCSLRTPGREPRPLPAGGAA